MSGSSCIVCGEFVLVGEICEDCEKKVLKNVRSKARVMSMVTTVALTVAFLLLVYKVWGLYAQGIMDMDISAIRSYPLAFEVSFDILRSPELFPWVIVGVVLIVFGLFYEVYYKKIFLDNPKTI